MARYSVNNYTVDVLLADIKSGNIAIPEMAKSKCKVERRNSCNREKVLIDG